MAVGAQHGFNVDEMLMSGVGAAIGSGVGSGVDATIGSSLGPTAGSVIKAGLTNALTQGIGVVTGLQDHFDWRGVVASGVGAGVGAAVGQGLSGNAAFVKDFGKFGVGFMAGAAGGLTTAVLRGGRIAVAQIAASAFGQALASGYTDDIKDASNGQQGEKLAGMTPGEFDPSTVPTYPNAPSMTSGQRAYFEASTAENDVQLNTGVSDYVAADDLGVVGGVHRVLIAGQLSDAPPDLTQQKENLLGSLQDIDDLQQVAPDRPSLAALRDSAQQKLDGVNAQLRDAEHTQFVDQLDRDVQASFQRNAEAVTQQAQQIGQSLADNLPPIQIAGGAPNLYLQLSTQLTNPRAHAANPAPAAPRSAIPVPAITINQLRTVMPNAGSRLNRYLGPLNTAMEEFNINTPERQAAFLAQVAHESGELRYVRELASGRAYEGRRDLGNTHPGDGVLYRGRGAIQITGRSNYQTAGRALGLDLINHPELLENPTNAVRSAAWFWSTHGLNNLADRGDFRTITRRINGGLNGWHDRLHYYEQARQALIGQVDDN